MRTQHINVYRGQPVPSACDAPHEYVEDLTIVSAFELMVPVATANALKFSFTLSLFFVRIWFLLSFGLE
jgi:hypothetical protein